MGDVESHTHALLGRFLYDAVLLLHLDDLIVLLHHVGFLELGSQGLESAEAPCLVTR